MSREIFAGMVFIVSALLDWKVPHIELQLLASAGAFFLMISQAGIVYDARAIKTWNSNLMRWLLLSTSISLGTGLILLIIGLEKLSFDNALLLIGACCIIFNLLLLLLYVGDQKILSGEETKSLRSLKSLFVTVCHRA
jgi:DMSO reductase anchor subunit